METERSDGNRGRCDSFLFSALMLSAPVLTINEVGKTTFEPRACTTSSIAVQCSAESTVSSPAAETLRGALRCESAGELTLTGQGSEQYEVY